MIQERGQLPSLPPPTPAPHACPVTQCPASRGHTQVPPGQGQDGANVQPTLTTSSNANHFPRALEARDMAETGQGDKRADTSTPPHCGPRPSQVETRRPGCCLFRRCGATLMRQTF